MPRLHSLRRGVGGGGGGGLRWHCELLLMSVFLIVSVHMFAHACVCVRMCVHTVRVCL